MLFIWYLHSKICTIYNQNWKNNTKELKNPILRVPAKNNWSTWITKLLMMWLFCWLVIAWKIKLVGIKLTIKKNRRLLWSEWTPSPEDNDKLNRSINTCRYAHRKKLVHIINSPLNCLQSKVQCWNSLPYGGDSHSILHNEW